MVFRADLLDSSKISLTRNTCQESCPFPHTVIKNAFEEAFLRLVRKEVETNLQYKFEENDVYRLQRSTHLANISNPDEYSPDLLKNLTCLRDALYSFQFREWLSAMTGVGPLSGTTSSMAVNLYKPGGHLLAHDDCNPKSKKRRVSFILYLTDPDSPWKTEWGGNLRLYAGERRKNSNGDSVLFTLPMWTKVIQPCFNQLVFFAVRPGETYHEVEEVAYSGVATEDQNRRRLALSGWFHAAQEGDEGFDEAFQENEMREVQQLHEIKAIVHEFHGPPACFRLSDDLRIDEYDVSGSLSQKDVHYLLSFLSPKILDPAFMHQLLQSFCQQSVLELDPFLCEEFASNLHDHISLSESGLRESAVRNLSCEWKTARPPEVHRYLYIESSGNPGNPAIYLTPVAQLLDNLFRSPSFRKWLSLATGCKLSNTSRQPVLARRFRRVLDYILSDSHDSMKPQLEYTLNMTPTKFGNKGKRGARDNSGEGGYIIAEDDAINAMFSGGKSTHARSIISDYRNPMAWNNFTIVLRSTKMDAFVKYMSREASGDRLDVIGKVQLD